jgi:RNA polymerase sigma-70 factor (ECF subfamily)
VTESQQRLYAYIYSLLGSTASAWDVLQETNIVLWAKRDEFEPGSNFRAWSHTVARFQVLAYLRDRTREPLSLLTPEIFEKMEGEAIPDFDNHEARLNALATCLKELAPTAAKIVRLHYAERRSLKQVGELLSMNANAVKQALFRTRRTLLQCIESTIETP